jgi:Tol biopolymer transport system component
MKKRIVAGIAVVALWSAGFTFGQEKMDCRGPYLGQALPGMTAELFAPGVISSGLSDRDVVVSPDGLEIFYGILEYPRAILIRLFQEGGRWKRQVAPFSGVWDDYEPHFSADGKRLYFVSNRPLDGKGESKDFDIWFIEKTAKGWGEPKNPGAPVNTEKDEFYPSVTKDGTVYLTSADMKILRCRNVEGILQSAEVLSDSVNSGRAEYNACIALDESFLIFTSHGWDKNAGHGDLFVVFRKPDGSWSSPRNLGPDVNSRVLDISPALSPDGKILFFSSTRRNETVDPEPIRSFGDIFRRMNVPQNGKLDVYWVDSRVIEAVRPATW